MSIKYKDIASHETGVTEQWMDSRTDDPKP